MVGSAPAHEGVILTQTLEGVHPSAAGLMATKDAIGALTLEQDEVGKGTEVTIAKHHVIRL
jgi:hypothetical protein